LIAVIRQLLEEKEAAWRPVGGTGMALAGEDGVFDVAGES
jgi:hypothetical protein